MKVFPTHDHYIFFYFFMGQRYITMWFFMMWSMVMCYLSHGRNLHQHFNLPCNDGHILVNSNINKNTTESETIMCLLQCARDVYCLAVNVKIDTVYVYCELFKETVGMCSAKAILGGKAFIKQVCITMIQHIAILYPFLSFFYSHVFAAA